MKKKCYKESKRRVGKRSIRAYIYDIGNIIDACHVSYRGKSQRQRQRAEVRKVMDDTFAFATKVRGKIVGGTYKVGDYRHFELKDRKKKRNISVLPYADRCVQNDYKGGIEPVIINQATDDMCAGLPGRGVTSSIDKWCVVRKVQRIMRTDKAVWMWQGDISKFYDSIHNVIVMKELERIVSDKEVLSLMREHVMKQGELAIGDPMSHLLASLVIAPLVRYLKANGATLVNYADDFWCVAETREEMYRIKKLAEEYAVTHLRLHFKPSQVRRIDAAPFRFCGYVFYPNGKVLLCSDTKKKYVRTRHKERSKASYNGMLLCCNSRHLRKKVEMNDNNRKSHGKETDTLRRKTA